MGTIEDVIRVALAQIGKPYVWAKAGPDSFDCSGLMVYAFRIGAGVSVPHFTGAIWARYPHVSRASLVRGDLVFPDPGHVGLYLGNGQYVNAPHTGARVRIDTVRSFWGGARVPGVQGGASVPSLVLPVGSVAGLVEPVGTGLEDIRDMLKQLFDVAGELDKIAGYLKDPKSWVRIGLFVGGGTLVVYGMIKVGG